MGFWREGGDKGFLFLFFFFFLLGGGVKEKKKKIVKKKKKNRGNRASADLGGGEVVRSAQMPSDPPRLLAGLRRLVDSESSAASCWVRLRYCIY